MTSILPESAPTPRNARPRPAPKPRNGPPRTAIAGSQTPSSVLMAPGRAAGKRPPTWNHICPHYQDTFFAFIASRRNSGRGDRQLQVEWLRIAENDAMFKLYAMAALVARPLSNSREVANFGASLRLRSNPRARGAPPFPPPKRTPRCASNNRRRIHRRHLVSRQCAKPFSAKRHRR